MTAAWHQTTPCVLLPVYRHWPADPVDSLAVASILTNLPDLPRFVTGPADHTGRLEALGFRRYETPQGYWEHPGTYGYSPLMCSPGLYRGLDELGFTHVLIHHLDAVTFGGEELLRSFAEGWYDNIGAPIWGTVDGMNGGYTLRRIQACLNRLDGQPDWVNVDAWHRAIGGNEDLWWSTQSGIRQAPRGIAWAFAWETEPEVCWRLNDRRLPLGAHAPHRYGQEFWERLGGVGRLALGGGDLVPDDLAPPIPGAAQSVDE